jgi:hypothetical protein
MVATDCAEQLNSRSRAMQFVNLLKVTLAISTLLAFAALCRAQTEKTATPDDKAEQIVQKAIQAVGGNNYLKIQTVTGHGFFTEFKDGVPTIPNRFVDYIAYPDRERTEFTGGGARTIQANVADKGWLFDGAARTLKDQTAQQIEEFHFGMLTSMENLLHGWWKQKSATLSYVGRREAGLGRRNEIVKLSYPDGFWVEYEFAATDGMPAKVLYKRKLKNPDTDEVVEVSEEDRLFKHVNIDGVLTPFIIDHFRNGVQTSRINYETVEYNKPLADSFFAKPANIKAIK